MTTKHNADLEEKVAVIMPYEKCEEFYVEDLGVIDRKPVYSFFKRALDIVLSILALPRRTRIDELLQFRCILKGEMSPVGPIPECAR